MKRLLNMFVMLLVLMLAAQGTALAAGKVGSDNIGTSIGPDYIDTSIGLESQELYKVETYINEGTLKVTTKDAATGKALGSVKVDIVLVKKTKSGTKYETVKSVKTDSKGNKSVKVKPGSYEIRVKKVPSGYYAEGTGKATVKGGKSASASIKINPLFTCKITVLSDKKKPISGATVKATNGEVTVTAKTNSKGVATLKNVKYGKNSIKITKKNKNVDVNYSKKLKLEGKSKKTLSKTVSVPKKNIKSLVTETQTVVAAETQIVVTKEPAYYYSAPDEPADHQEPLSGQEEPPTTYEEPAILIEPTEEEYTITHTTETVEIPFKTVYVDAPGWLLGEEAVGQEGRNGEKVITYEIKTDKNGTEVSRRAISESITKNVINKEIFRGTFVPVVTYRTESLPCLPGLDESKRSSSLDAACASWAMSMAKNDKVAHSNHEWGESVGAWGSIEGVLYGRNYTVISTQNGQTYSGNVSLASHGGEMLATGSEWGAGCVARTESQPDGTYVTIYYACARSN